MKNGSLPSAIAIGHVVRHDRCRMVAAMVFCVVLLAFEGPAWGQVAGCPPVAQRTGEIGCWLIADQVIGQLPAGPISWHLDTFATTAEAETARRPGSIVVESLGKVWLLTIAEVGWKPSRGTRVAEIGPLPVNPDTKYAAQYLEAIFQPGMKAIVHRHGGPEAWYTATGETCLETPEGKMVGRPGQFVIVPGGLPMELTATGTELRRAVVLILYDVSQPATTPDHDWKPKGLCGR